MESQLGVIILGAVLALVGGLILWLLTGIRSQIGRLFQLRDGDVETRNDLSNRVTAVEVANKFLFGAVTQRGEKDAIARGLIGNQSPQRLLRVPDNPNQEVLRITREMANDRALDNMDDEGLSVVVASRLFASGVVPKQRAIDLGVSSEEYLVSILQHIRDLRELRDSSGL